MTSRTLRSLPQLLSFIVDNRGRTCPTSENGIPLIATNCLKEGKREAVFENIRYVDEHTHATWFRAHPEPGDILFVCKGSPGRVALVPDPVPYCIAQDMVALRAEPTIVDANYLYYRLRSPDVQESIENMHVGTMIPHFKKGDFGKLKFAVHDSISEQQAIAELLAALDNKIAVNDKAHNISRKLACATFARFARQGGKVRIRDVAQLVARGITPKYVASDGVIVLNQKCVRDQRINLAPSRMTQESSTRAEKLLQRDDVLVNSTGAGTLGRVARWTQDIRATVDSHITIVRFEPDLIDPVCAGFGLLQIEKEVEGLAEGSTGQTELRRDLLAGLEIFVPNKALQGAVGAELSALDKLSLVLQQESDRLAATRDELLPLLMSGQVRVQEAEKVVEGVV